MTTKLWRQTEFLLAVCSGIIMLLAWLMTSLGWITPSIFFYVAAYLLGGYFKAKEGWEKLVHERKLSVELLMMLAALGSAAIGYWSEGAVLIFIFALSGSLESYTFQKSERDLSALMQLKPETAYRIRGEVEEVVSVEELQLEDIILVKPGERIPADGQVIKGGSSVDESAINGEPLPRWKEEHDEVYAGTMNNEGTLYIKVTKEAKDTLFQKILTLVQSAKQEKPPTQQLIEKYEGAYVKTVLSIVMVMIVLPPFLVDWSFQESIYRAMVMLVVASPCAIVASIMPAVLAAISNGARQGILFKGGANLEILARVKAIALDKTGTLTKGTPMVEKYYIRTDLPEDIFWQRVATIEHFSSHPLAQALVRFVQSKSIEYQTEVEELINTPGMGISAKINGVVWQIGKPKWFQDLPEPEFYQEGHQYLAEEGCTLVVVADEEGIAGIIGLKDQMREEGKEAISQLKKLGVYTCMLTGDHQQTAQKVSEELGLDFYLANCLPEVKQAEIVRLREAHQTIAMIGDGINDAPALASADIGIAMGEGSDVALDTADLVLMKNDLTKIAKAIHLAQRMRKIIWQNLFLSAVVILLLIIGNFFQQVSLPLGVIGHEGSTILVILNGLRLLKE